MDFTVRGEKFTIELVNNWVLEKYSEMAETLASTIPKSVEVQQISEENQKETDLAKAQERLKKALEIKAEMNEANQKAVDIRQAILQELLTTNGYEYDIEWWLHKTDPDDINEFILCCVQKDRETTGKTGVKKVKKK